MLVSSNPLMLDAVDFVARQVRGRFQVEVRWNQNGPEDVQGYVAAEIEVFREVELDKHELLIVLRDGAEASGRFVTAFCQVYGLYGSVRARLVHQENLRDLGWATVREP